MNDEPLFCWQHRVAFHDTDAAGVVHFSRFPVWMEECEHAFLRRCGVPVLEEVTGGRKGWPRVSVHVDYKAPLRLEEQFTVALELADLRTRSLIWQCTFTRERVLIAEGEVAVVHALVSPDGSMQAIDLPPALLSRLPGEPAPGTVRLSAQTSRKESAT